MSEHNKLAAQYLREVARVLPCPRRERARYLHDLGGSVEQYIRTHSVFTAETLRAQFGTPVQIAEDYAAAVPLSAAREYAGRRRFRRILIALASCAVILLGIMAGLKIKTYKDTQSFLHGYVETAILEGPAAEAYWEELKNDAIEVYVTK